MVQDNVRTDPARTFEMTLVAQRQLMVAALAVCSRLVGLIDGYTMPGDQQAHEKGTGT